MNLILCHAGARTCFTSTCAALHLTKQSLIEISTVRTSAPLRYIFFGRKGEGLSKANGKNSDFIFFLHFKNHTQRLNPP